MKKEAMIKTLKEKLSKTKDEKLKDALKSKIEILKGDKIVQK